MVFLCVCGCCRHRCCRVVVAVVSAATCVGIVVVVFIVVCCRHFGCSHCCLPCWSCVGVVLLPRLTFSYMSTCVGRSVIVNMWFVVVVVVWFLYVVCR